MDSKNTDFAPGDIIELYGETYQVLQNDGETGMVIPFPSEEVPAERVVWNAEKIPYTKIGNAQVPGPTPCSTNDGNCPTDGRGAPLEISVNMDTLRK